MNSVPAVDSELLPATPPPSLSTKTIHSVGQLEQLELEPPDLFRGRETPR